MALLPTLATSLLACTATGFAASVLVARTGTRPASDEGDQAVGAPGPVPPAGVRTEAALYVPPTSPQDPAPPVRLTTSFFWDYASDVPPPFDLGADDPSAGLAADLEADAWK